MTGCLPYASFDIQRASRNLDSSEQIFAGGPGSVRAYDNGVVSGTQGEWVTLEWRRALLGSWPGSWQGAIFLDGARVDVAKTVYGSGSNTASLYGSGLSLNWTGSTGWSMTSSLATPLGNTPVLAGRRDSVRAWLALQKAF